MNSIFLILTVSASPWTVVATGDGIRRSVNVASIVHSGSSVLFWENTTKDIPFPDGSVSATAWARVDCDKHLRKIISLVSYSADGSIVERSPTDMEMSPIVANSMGEVVEHFVCSQ